ncbi:hypothetical protein ON010_g17175 [Phytophthora cinnamomi]|nr:hypothetical protein ON010_g17175 [Phytophthora cinnamomi]
MPAIDDINCQVIYTNPPLATGNGDAATVRVHVRGRVAGTGTMGSDAARVHGHCLRCCGEPQPLHSWRMTDRALYMIPTYYGAERGSDSTIGMGLHSYPRDHGSLLYLIDAPRALPSLSSSRGLEALSRAVPVAARGRSSKRQKAEPPAPRGSARAHRRRVEDIVTAARRRSLRYLNMMKATTYSRSLGRLLVLPWSRRAPSNGSLPETALSCGAKQQQNTAQKMSDQLCSSAAVMGAGWSNTLDK